MKYLRVKQEMDGTRRRTLKNTWDGEFVGGELYTIKERAQFTNTTGLFDCVDINRKNTCWIFGRRFENI